MYGVSVEARPGAHGEEFVNCHYDLTTLEHPKLGPYSDASAAARARDEISIALSGASS